MIEGWQAGNVARHHLKWRGKVLIADVLEALIEDNQAGSGEREFALPVQNAVTWNEVTKRFSKAERQSQFDC